MTTSLRSDSSASVWRRCSGTSRKVGREESNGNATQGEAGGWRGRKGKVSKRERGQEGGGRQLDNSASVEKVLKHGRREIGWEGGREGGRIAEGEVWDERRNQGLFFPFRKGELLG